MKTWNQIAKQLTVLRASRKMWESSYLKRNGDRMLRQISFPFLMRLSQMHKSEYNGNFLRRLVFSYFYILLAPFPPPSLSRFFLFFFVYLFCFTFSKQILVLCQMLMILVVLVLVLVVVVVIILTQTISRLHCLLTRRSSYPWSGSEVKRMKTRRVPYSPPNSFRTNPETFFIWPFYF